MPARMIEVMRMLETWEIRTLLRILRDERVRQIAIQDYGAAPLHKLIKVLEAKLPADEDNQP